MDINVKDGLSIFRGDAKIGGFKVSNTGRITVPFGIEDGTYQIYRTYDPRIDEVKNIFSDVPKFSGMKRMNMAKFEPKTILREKKRPDLSFYVSSLKLLNSVKKYADRIYFEMNGETKEAERICVSEGKEFVTILPRFSSADEIADGAVMVHTPGQMYASEGRTRYGSYHMNMFNSMFPNILDQVTMSAELSRREIKEICAHYPGRLEQMVFGRIELMITRDPEMGNGRLRDEKGYEFPVYKDERGFSHILNSADLLLIDRLDEMGSMGIDSFGIDVRKRPVELAAKVAKAFHERDASKKNELKEMCGSMTYGHYARGV
jgi:putative protease